MQRDQLNTIVAQIEAIIPQFAGNGYIIQKGDDDSFKGITDDIAFWFFIDFQDGVEAVEFDSDFENVPNKGAVLVTGNYKLVAGMCGTNKHNAIQVLVGALSSTAADVSKAWTDSEVILSEQWEDKELKSDLQLYRVDFSLLSYETNLTKCLILECADDSC